MVKKDAWTQFAVLVGIAIFVVLSVLFKLIIGLTSWLSLTIKCSVCFPLGILTAFSLYEDENKYLKIIEKISLNFVITLTLLIVLAFILGVLFSIQNLWLNIVSIVLPFAIGEFIATPWRTVKKTVESPVEEYDDIPYEVEGAAYQPEPLDDD